MDIQEMAERRQRHWSKMAGQGRTERCIQVERLTKMLEDAFVEKRRQQAQAKAHPKVS